MNLLRNDLPLHGAVSDPSVLDFFAQEGFRTNTITELDDEYMVEGDIAFSKEEVEHLLQETPANGRTEQVRYEFLVSCEEVRNISVWVDTSIPSSGSNNWRYEVQQAIDEWNGAHSSIRFVYTTKGEADITVQSDNDEIDENSVLAIAKFPKNGKAGNLIRINFDATGNVGASADKKRHLMLHELGHTVGFHHTDATITNDTIHITGTPKFDYASVMKSTIGSFGPWPGLSENDGTAARLLYPGSMRSTEWEEFRPSFTRQVPARANSTM